MPAMVDPAAALTLALAALPLMASPGPATLSIAGMSASQGLGPSLPFSFGVVSGSAAAALLVATGVTGALWALPGAAPVIQAVGLAYLLYLAYRIATAPVGAAAGTRPPAGCRALRWPSPTQKSAPPSARFSPVIP